MAALKAFKKARIIARGRMVEVPQEPLKPGELFAPGIFTGERMPKLKYVPAPNDGYPPAPRKKKAVSNSDSQPLMDFSARPDEPSPKSPIPTSTPLVEPAVKDAVHEYLSAIGRRGGTKGGKVRSAAKTRAARENAKLPRKKER